MRAPLKVLVSAFACNPCAGSEEGVGWGWVRAISRHHDLWVITADYHRGDIERALAADKELAARVKFHYVSPQLWHFAPTRTWKFIEASNLKPIMNRAYRLWQQDAGELGRRLHRQVGFDLVHLLTYVGFRFPGDLWRLDIPFVWGPIGGLENTPWRLLPGMGLSGAVYYAGRNLINTWQKLFLMAPRLAFRKARGIIAATQTNQREIRRYYGVDSEVICEIGPPGPIALGHSVRAQGEPLRLAWSGQHLPGKALPLLLQAAARLPQQLDWHLDILGAGSCTSSWKRQADRLGLNGRCTWHGWLKRDEAVSLMRQAHLFVITSLKDLTSTVLLEALSEGVPVICPHHCGFPDAVDETCGITVPVGSWGQLSGDLAAAIAELGADEGRRRLLAEGALRRSGGFGWEDKARRIDALYRRAVGTAAPVRPEAPADAAEAAACPSCLSVRFPLWQVRTNEYGSFPIHRCSRCGSAFVQPRPSAEQVRAVYVSQAYYQTSYLTPLEHSRAILAAERRDPVGTRDAERIVSRCRRLTPGRHFLDVGSGYGLFTKAAVEAGFQVDALDPSPSCREVFAAMNGFTPEAGFFDDGFAAGRQGRYDVVLLSQVLEHVVDLEQTIGRLWRLLAPGGIAAVAVPHFGSWVSSLEGRQDHFIVPPEHINYFSGPGLSRLFQRQGFSLLFAETSSIFSASGLRRRLRSRILGWAAGGALRGFLKAADARGRGLSLNAYFRKNESGRCERK